MPNANEGVRPLVNLPRQTFDDRSAGLRGRLIGIYTLSIVINIAALLADMQREVERLAFGRASDRRDLKTNTPLAVRAHKLKRLIGHG